LSNTTNYIFEAKYNEFEENLPKLANLDTPVDDDGNTLLHWCAACNQPNMARLLIMNGAHHSSPLLKNNFGETPLDVVIEREDESEFQEIIDLLNGE